MEESLYFLIKRLPIIAFIVLLFVSSTYSIEPEHLIDGWKLVRLVDFSTGERNNNVKGVYMQFFDGGTLSITNVTMRRRTTFNWILKGNLLTITTTNNSVKMVGYAQLLKSKERLNVIYRFSRYELKQINNKNVYVIKGRFEWVLEKAF